MQIPTQRVILSTHDFFYFVDVSDILYCRSENSYTTFYIQDEEPITVSISIKKVEQMLDSQLFIRSHQSYLINAYQIKSIHKTLGSEILLSNGVVIPISSRRKKDIMQFLSNWQRIQIP